MNNQNSETQEFTAAMYGEFCIFKREGSYVVTQVEEYDHPEAYTGNFTGWRYIDEEKARKVAYLLNEIKDPLAAKYLIELAGDH